MDYPEGFPENLQPPVDAAIHQAEINIVKLRRSEDLPENWQGAIWICLSSVFWAFANQICKAGKERLLTGQKMRKILDQYLSDLAVHYYRELVPVDVDPTETEQAVDAIIQLIKESKEWQNLQQQLKTIAENVAAATLLNHDQQTKTEVQENTTKTTSEERTELLLAYKRECKERGITVTDTMIAKAASKTWNDRTQVALWKGGDPRSKTAADKRIRAVLAKKPHLE